MSEPLTDSELNTLEHGLPGALPCSARAAMEIRNLRDDNTHLHMANQGVAHYRNCPNNAATGGNGPDPCMRCEAERLRGLLEAAVVMANAAKLRAGSIGIRPCPLCWRHVDAECRQGCPWPAIEAEARPAMKAEEGF